MKIKLDEWGFMPERAHDTDAGLDLKAARSAEIPPGEACVFSTGVHVELPHGCAGLIVAKSGLNIHHGIQSTGLIDEGYTGEVMVKLYNLGHHTVEIERGQKISQLVIIPVRYEDVEVVDDLEKTDRGDNGFGSTGR